MFLLSGRSTILARRDALDGCHDVGGRRVHRLATRHDRVDTERSQYLGKAVARRNGNEADRLEDDVGSHSRRLRRDQRVASITLAPHVVDVDLCDLAELGHSREHGPGVVGMDVHLEFAVRADDEFAATDRRDEVMHDVRDDLVAEEQELGAVEVLRVVPVVDRHDLEFDSDPADVCNVDRLAERCGDEPLEQDRQPEPAGIDHVVVLQDLQ
jgi:hypothetical protein